jgi:hypothetical protein
MKTEDQKAEALKQRQIETKYLMGTKAHHQLGDISRQTPDLFRATGETDNFWVGMWVTGFGFFNVLFPKATSRELTQKEREHFNKQYIQIGSGPATKLKV